MAKQGMRIGAVFCLKTVAERIGLGGALGHHQQGNLAWLSELQEAIEKRLFRLHYGEATPKLFMYDVTSSYLEVTVAEGVDELGSLYRFPVALVSVVSLNIRDCFGTPCLAMTRKSPLFQGRCVILEGGFSCRSNPIPASWNRSLKESSA